MNPDLFLTSATLRDRVKNFDYILDKVKQLKMIPTTNFASQEMVAQYYDVNTAVINMIVTRHRDELEKVGLIHKSKGDIINQVNEHRVRLLEEANLGQKGVHFSFKDGSEVLVPNRGLRTFSKQAVYHIALFLEESEIAEQVRIESTKALVTQDEKEQNREELAESDRIELEIKDIAAKWGVSMVFKETQKAADYTQQMIAKKNRQIAIRDEKIAELKPKATYYDVILSCKNAVLVTQIAKDYGMTARDFNDKLHDAGIQWKVGNQWVLYQRYASEGYVSSRTTHYYDKQGNERAAMSTLWTQKGRSFIYEQLKKEGILPIIELENSIQKKIPKIGQISIEDLTDGDES